MLNLFKLNKNNLLSVLKFLIGWPLSAVAFIFVFKLISSNASSTFKDIKDINFIFLSISFVLFIVYFFLRSYLWKLLLGSKGSLFSFKENTLHWSLSELKRYVPGNIWSFVSRAALFERENLSKKEVFLYIAHESIIICLATLLLSLFFLRDYPVSQTVKYLILIFSLFSIFIFLFGNLLSKKLSFIPFLGKLFRLFVPANNPYINLQILLVGLLTFVVFGIATYFSIVSILYLDLRSILILISLFNFSFFIGYVSLITPMGLGIREGTMALALTNFIGSSTAAIASLFTRIIFIIAELIAIGLIVLWNKTRLDIVKKTEDFIYENKHLVILSLFVALYITYYTTASFLRYDNFYTGRFDLGNMDQTVWNTLQGRVFQLTNPDGTTTVSRLSIHADFILALVSPLYLLWSNPKMLLLLQSVILGLGGYFVYLISLSILKNKNISLALATAFLLNPAVGFVNLYDFHPVALATTFLLGAFYFFTTKRYLLFTIFMILAGITKEEVWILASVFGLILTISSLKKERKNAVETISGLVLIIGGVGISYILIEKIIPSFKGSDHFALEYYSGLGSSSGEIVKNIILNPIKIISIIIDADRLKFLNQLFMPLGYLSVINPLALIFAVPDLMISLLSSNKALHQIYYQYTSVITPFVFISAIYSLKLILAKFKIKAEYLAIYIIFSTLTTLYFTGPLPATKRPNIDMFSKQLSYSSILEKYLQSIPEEYSVAATNNLGSHLSQRPTLYSIPYGLDTADMIVILIDHGFSGDSVEKQKQMIEVLKQNSKYKLDYEHKDFISFKKSSLN